jgi:hypothetical protein
VALSGEESSGEDIVCFNPFFFLLTNACMSKNLLGFRPKVLRPK